MQSGFPRSKIFPANGIHSIYFQLQFSDDTFPADGNIDEPYQSQQASRRQQLKLIDKIMKMWTMKFKGGRFHL